MVTVGTVADSVGYGSTTLGSYSPPYYVMVETVADFVGYGSTTLGSYSSPYFVMGKWLPTLRNLVAQINDTFSRNFREMAVAGEVSLDEHDMDFDQFGILIKVKFRQNGQLEVLSAHHQSGGERSVSTIVYLVSLQDLTNCPFRVVDEINQGMDPINERKMFQQLVRAASKPNTPQCFLLTPKLLPDLQYSEACSILNDVFFVNQSGLLVIDGA
ncbi:P-loop containing nucleoside triphosphate hydrolase [Sesbania bispinosa]|nr:P-loop containing nucleoside triphosphate hydrolase [Sesbania bispinosa]